MRIRQKGCALPNEVSETKLELLRDIIKGNNNENGNTISVLFTSYLICSCEDLKIPPHRL